MLDPVTLLVGQFLAISLVTAVYGADVVRRGLTAADACWVVGFLTAGLGYLGHLTALDATQPPWLDGLASGLIVTAVGAFWAGVHVSTGHRSLLWLPPVTGLVVALAEPTASAVAAGSGSSLTGDEVFHVGVAAWAIAAAVAVARGPAARYFGGVVIGFGLGTLGAGLLVRLLVALLAGQGSTIVAGVIDPGVASLGVALALATAGMGALLLRAGERGAMQLTDPLFDPSLGVRTPLGLEQRAEQVLTQARSRGQDVVVVVVDVADPDTLREAYGSRMLEASRELVAAVLLEIVPRGGIVGLCELADHRFVVVLPDHDAERATRWADDVRRAIRSSRVQVDADALRLSVGTGIAVGDADLAALVAEATADVSTDDDARRPRRQGI